MRVPRPGVLAVVAALAAVASGCAGQADTAAVERLIEEDWNGAAAGDARWPGRPELEGTRVDDVDCPAEAAAGTVVCTVRLARRGPAADVTVVADVDATGAVRRWRLGG